MPHRTNASPGRDTAILIIDVQVDFCWGGALAVPGGDKVIPALNQVIRKANRRNLKIYASRDWHPAASTHFKVGGGIWPVHCVAGTPGARFNDKLQLPVDTYIVSKGLEPNCNGYSVFDGSLDNKVDFGRTLNQELITHLIVGGLATDYCVKRSVLDALNLGLTVTVLTDAIAAVERQAGDEKRALQEMRRAGAQLTDSTTISF